MTDNKELNIIIKGCKHKKLRDQEKLYKLFYAYGMSICLRYSNSREESVEILNDSFLKVYDNMKKFNTEKSFKAWFRRILINTAIDYYRKKTKLYKIINIDDVEYETFQTEKIDQLEVQDLMKLLNELPDNYRLVFNLYEIEGYKHQEISELLNIPTSSSRTYLTRAKKMLRELYKTNFQKAYAQVV